MSQHLQPLRGMNDILPDDIHWWQWVEDTARRVFAAYGYREIRVPILERTELFKRSIGEVTDIVEKEMYTFDDRSGDSVTMRPEATAGIVRAGLSNGLLHNQQQRVWCTGPMFRYERPQKGRFRQFHQLDVEALGFDGPDIDAEMILLSARLWRELGLDGLVLELNSLGTPESRAVYREALVEWFSRHRDALDDDSLRRLETNPLRILDSKNPAMAEVIAGAPEFGDYLDDASVEHFAALRTMLDDAGIEYRLNPRLVRGLDYYSRTVFEWLTDRLGAQAAVCSGGRYDGLVTQLGGRPTPAIGWALGIERLVEVLRLSVGEREATVADVYVLAADDARERETLKWTEALRDTLPAHRVLMHCGGGSLKSRMKKADRSGAAYAVIVGGDELARGELSVKALRGDGAQQAVAADGLGAWLASRLPATG